MIWPLLGPAGGLEEPAGNPPEKRITKNKQGPYLLIFCRNRNKVLILVPYSLYFLFPCSLFFYFCPSFFLFFAWKSWKAHIVGRGAAQHIWTFTRLPYPLPRRLRRGYRHHLPIPPWHCPAEHKMKLHLLQPTDTNQNDQRMLNIFGAGGERGGTRRLGSTLRKRNEDTHGNT